MTDWKVRKAPMRIYGDSNNPRHWGFSRFHKNWVVYFRGRPVGAYRTWERAMMHIEAYYRNYRDWSRPSG